MLAGDFELVALLFNLAEEASILNSQGGLGCKRPQKLDDLQRKCAGGLPDYSEPAEQVIVADEGNREQGPVSSANERVTHSALGGRCQDCRDPERLLRLPRPPAPPPPFSD